MRSNTTTDADAGDERLLAELRAGSAAAFELLIDRYHPRLSTYLTTLLRDNSAAEEYAHETFIEVFTSLHALRDDRSFEAWLFTIARNKARMHLRRRAIVQFVGLDPLMSKVGGWLGRDHAGGIDAVPARTAVEAALARLSAADREALLLHSWAGFTAREVATILNISEGAATKRVTRARGRFAELYGEVAGLHDVSRPLAKPGDAEDERERA